jgi:hypothetical protein
MGMAYLIMRLQLLAWRLNNLTNISQLPIWTYCNIVNFEAF